MVPLSLAICRLMSLITLIWLLHSVLRMIHMLTWYWSHRCFFFMYFTTIFLNCVTSIKYLPYVWSRVYSPIYRYSEYLPYTTMFRASIFSPPAPISNQNISLLSACPHEYFFFSIYFMSSYDQYHISSEYFPQSVSLLFQYIVFPSEYFPFSVANFRVSSFSCLCYSHFPLIFT